MDIRQRAAEALDRITATHTHDSLNLDFKGQRSEIAQILTILQEPQEIVREFTQGECTACDLKVINILRTTVGRPPLYNAVSESRYQARIKVCSTCPHMASVTKLKWTPPFIEVTGLNCRACGCFVHAKAALAWEDCPHRLWPQAA